MCLVFDSDLIARCKFSDLIMLSVREKLRRLTVGLLLYISFNQINGNLSTIKRFYMNNILIKFSHYSNIAFR